VHAAVHQTSRVPTDFSNTGNVTLPYLTANYRLMTNWSVYAQYAKGFLAPDLNTTYVVDPTASAFDPQMSTNYQVGTVYRADHLTLDADVYQVDFTNKTVQLGVGQVVNGVTLTTPTFFNIGGVKYKGWEAQATYAFDFGLAIFANGSKNDTTVNDPRGGTTSNGTVNVSNDGKPTNGAPEWTAAAGLIYANGPLRASLTHKIVGQQYASLGGVNKIQPLETTGLDVSYDFGKFELFAGVQNLSNHQDIVSISGTPPAVGAVDNRRYTFQSGRFVQVGAKVNF
jgi:iron complex outermembrane receptor protein